MQPPSSSLWLRVLLTQPCLSLQVCYWLLHAQLSAQTVLEAEVSITAFVAAGDTNAAIKVKIRHNNVTIRPHKTGTSYSALCTLVEETWPLLTAVDYTFQTDSDDEFASEV